MRLAFAVAAHMEPEILIIDEVLAVGDAEFQKKCLGKMQDVAKAGRTVLFVSHQMGSIQNLCTMGLELGRGRIIMNGLVHDVVTNYARQTSSSASFERSTTKKTPSRPAIQSVALSWIRENSATIAPLGCITIEIQSPEEVRVALDLRIQDLFSVPVAFGSLGTLDEALSVILRSGSNIVTFVFPTNSLANGSYTASIDLTIPFVEIVDRAEQCLQFDLERPASGSGRRLVSQEWGYGSVHLPLHLNEKTH